MLRFVANVFKLILWAILDLFRSRASRRCAATRPRKSGVPSIDRIQFVILFASRGRFSL